MLPARFPIGIIYWLSFRLNFGPISMKISNIEPLYPSTDWDLKLKICHLTKESLETCAQLARGPLLVVKLSRILYENPSEPSLVSHWLYSIKLKIRYLLETYSKSRTFLPSAHWLVLFWPQITDFEITVFWPIELSFSCSVVAFSMNIFSSVSAKLGYQTIFSAQVQLLSETWTVLIAPTFRWADSISP